MRLLTIKERQYLYGGMSETVTTTSSSNQYWQCECQCTNLAEKKFIEDFDDNWLVWLISCPFLMLADSIYWVFKPPI